MGARTLLVCLNAVEPRLAHRWIDENRLPALGRLALHGEARALENFPGFGDGGFWPSLTTCSGPANHGRYYFTQLVPGTYRLRQFAAARDFDVVPFWADVERAGGHVAVVDMVRSPLARLRHGIEVANWMVHDPDSAPFGTPSKLIRQLQARFGPDSLGGSSDHFVRAGGSLEALVQACESRVAAKTQWGTEMLRAHDWDLFALTFHEGHDIGHMCWHVHDPAHPRHDPQERQRLGDPLLRIYGQMDEALATLREAAGPEALTIVISGPGMEANRTGNAALPHLLARLAEVASTATSAEPRATAAGAEHPASWPRRAYRQYAPRSLKKLARAARESVQGTDEERARAAAPWFAVPYNDDSGAIRLNLAGREPRGRIRPGAEQTRTLDQLCDALGEIRDDQGRTIVKEFIRIADVMHGRRLHCLPDLLVSWNRSANYRSLHSPRIGHLELPMEEPARTGDHTRRGELLVSEPCGLHADGSGALDPVAAGRIVRDIILARTRSSGRNAKRETRAE